MEIKLENGDKVFFKTELRGKEYRQLKTRVSESVSGTGDFLPNKFIDYIFKAIDIFVDKIVTEQGVEVVPSLDYFDGLSLEDADKVYTALEEATKSAKVGGKKKSQTK